MADRPAVSRRCVVLQLLLRIRALISLNYIGTRRPRGVAVV